MTIKPNKPETEKPETISHAPSIKEPTPELKHAETESFPVQAQKPKKMGRSQRILLLTLIGLTAVVVIFLAGILTDHYARFSPMKAGLTGDLILTQDQLGQAKQSMADLQSQVVDTSAQLVTANDRISVIEKDKENLQADMDSANLHIELLRTIVELKTANIELRSDNVAGAKIALSNTAAHLEMLNPLVKTVDASLAASMPKRLNLILDNMDTNSTTTQSDLGMLAKNLQSVETLLFGKK